MESNINFKYYAFISYSHEDEEVAKRIQKKLTEYKLPSVIRKANPLLPDNVRPIFRDVTNLTTGMLQGKLNSELEHSKFLIVLCSPNSAKPNDENKHWVNNEVQHFIDIGRTEYIIPVIVGGEPHAKSPEEECFCPALLSLPGGDELLGIDIRNNSKKKISFGKSLKRKLGIPDEDDLEEKGIVHIVAKMLGLNIDDLWDWNKKAQKRKAYTKLFTAAACFVLMLSVGLTVYFKKFHVYHEYYVDCVDYWLVPKGIHKLKKNEVKKRAYSYKLDIQNQKVIRCTIIGCDNKTNRLHNIGDNPYLDVQNPIITYEYNKQSVIPSKMRYFNFQNQLQVEYEIYKINDNLLRVNMSKKSEGIKTLEESVMSIYGETKVKISSQELFMTDEGFVYKRIYYKYHDEDIIGFTSDNICGEVIEHDFMGRPISKKTLGIDGKGNFVVQENIQGIAEICYEYSEFGTIAKYSFFDLNKELVFQDSIFGKSSTCNYVYDNDGNIEKMDFYAKNNHIGFIIFNRNKNTNVIEKCFFNGEQHPYYSQGIHKIKYEYDVNNNISSLSNYDENDTNIFDGTAASYEYKYDNYNNLIQEIRYNTNKTKLDSLGPITEWKYDRYFNVIEESYYDYDHNSSYNFTTGCSIERYIYNDKNQQIESRSYDKNNKLMNDIHGVAIYKYEYDKLGNTKNYSYYDCNNDKAMFDGIYSSVEHEYNEKGQRICQLVYDSNDNLIKYKYENYFPIMVLEYNQQGYNTVAKAYDEKKSFICGVRRQFDNSGKMTEYAYIDEYNNLVSGPNSEIAKTKYDYSSEYYQESFYNDRNEPINCDYYYWRHRVYEKNQLILKEEYYGSDGKLCCNKNGFAIREKQYDDRGNCIFDGFFNEKKVQIDVVTQPFGAKYSYVYFDSFENNYKPTFYDENDNELNAYKYIFISHIFTGSQAYNSQIKVNDVLLSYNNWKYDSENLDLDLFSREIYNSENKKKQLSLYNPSTHIIYNCEFSEDKIGVGFALTDIIPIVSLNELL